jgi:hypothetical protein
MKLATYLYSDNDAIYFPIDPRPNATVIEAGNTKEGSNTGLLTSCLTGLD